MSWTPRIHPFPAIDSRISGTPNIAIRSQPAASSATAADSGDDVPTSRRITTGAHG